MWEDYFKRIREIRKDRKPLTEQEKKRIISDPNPDPNLLEQLSYEEIDEWKDNNYPDLGL